MKCPNCNKELPWGAVFCRHCMPVSSYAGDVEASSCESIKTFDVKGVTFKMIHVVGGGFVMGMLPCYVHQSIEERLFKSATPMHKVNLNSYYIGETQVTQALWKAVMGSNPSKFKGNNRPVENVSWNDCQTFITKLNQLTGETFRLPTEAEWEYAARGGNKSEYYRYAGNDNSNNVAWHDENSGRKTHEVAILFPNELGIYDMSGNVWEWCQDWYGPYSDRAQTNPTGPSAGLFRVLRGGSWYEFDTYCCTANRGYLTPAFADNSLGLRLAR